MHFMGRRWRENEWNSVEGVGHIPMTDCPYAILKLYSQAAWSGLKSTSRKISLYPRFSLYTQCGNGCGRILQRWRAELCAHWLAWWL